MAWTAVAPANQLHGGLYPFLHPRDDRVVDLVVREVAPPRQYVGVGEHSVGQAVLGLIQ
jgi:hypothetical protein